MSTPNVVMREACDGSDTTLNDSSRDKGGHMVMNSSSSTYKVKKVSHSNPWRDNARLMGLKIASDGVSFAQLDMDIAFFQLVRGPYVLRRSYNLLFPS